MRLIVSIFTLCMLAIASGAIAQVGCTDPTASNFNPEATIDNGSCCYANSYTFTSTSFADLEAYTPNGTFSQFVWFPGTSTLCMEDGCAQFFIINYTGEQIVVTYQINMGEPQEVVVAAHATLNFGINSGEGVAGCADPGACNFDPAVTCPDNSCTYSCFGCTDTAALNFNPAASIDDGSCCFSQNNFFTVQSSGPATFTIADDTGYPASTVNFPAESGFCFTGFCGGVFAEAPGSEEVTFSILGPNGIVYAQGTTVNGSLFAPGSVSGVVGCSDPNACNFNPNLTCQYYTSCDYGCLGCTDPTAANFDADATIEDGSCCTDNDWVSVYSQRSGWLTIGQSSFGGTIVNVFINENETTSFCLPDGCYMLDFYASTPTVEGATLTLTASNGNILLEIPLSYAVFFEDFTKNGVVGCDDPNACNFDPAATCAFFNSCDYSCVGCTDATADNYDPNATIDNGSCCYGAYLIETSGNAHWSLGAYTDSWFWQWGFTPFTNTFCPQNGCYILTISNDFGEEMTYSVTDSDGVAVASGSLDAYASITIELDINAISGCTDVNACNYNPNATCSIFSECDYSCYGCTDVNAPNYDSTATFDDGSCCTENWYTVTADGDLNFYVYSLDGNFGSGGTYPDFTGFCMGDNCFQGYVFSYSSNVINYTVTDQEGNIVASGATEEFSGQDMFFVSQGDVFGCTDLGACNFDPNATCSDFTTCDYSCLGCTDASAPNFDPNATIDNGTCCIYSWFTIEAEGAMYWSAYNYSYGAYPFGNYPEQSGFCMPEGCFSIYACSWTGEEQDFIIRNENGEIIFQGNTSTSCQQAAGIDTQQAEVAGCMEPSACNYNPEATCDASNCQFYCGGCTDISAINYNVNAAWNDGTCFYTIEPPMMQIFTEVSAELEDHYFVRVMVMATGNGAPYVATTNIDQGTMMIAESGQYLMGPFPCDQNVVVSMHSASLGVADYSVSDPVVAPCGIIQSVENTDSSNLLVYPNPASNVMFISGFNGLAEKIMISDLTGRIVLEEQNRVLTNNAELNVEQLTNGIYNLTILAQGKLSNRVIVIKK